MNNYDWLKNLCLHGLLWVGALQVGCTASTPSQATPSPAPSTQTIETPFKARGNEPGWAVDIAAGEIKLLADYGNTVVNGPAGEPEIQGDRTTYVTSAGAHRVRVVIVNQPCADGMSGMPYPKTVTVVLDDQELHGCGGDPKELLVGPAWTVVEMNGQAVGDARNATLQFGSDGAISGRSFCNSYSGTYTMTGEFLSMKVDASTLMGCDSEAMALEKLFIELVPVLRRFEIAGDGVMVIHADDGRSVRLQR